MKTNKKLKLNTKKVVILSNEQQNAIQGGYAKLTINGNDCFPFTRPFTKCYDLGDCLSGNIDCPINL